MLFSLLRPSTPPTKLTQQNRGDAALGSFSVQTRRNPKPKQSGHQNRCPCGSGEPPQLPGRGNRLGVKILLSVVAVHLRRVKGRFLL